MTNEQRQAALNVNSTQALGIALSVLMPNCTMTTCQILAKSMEEHLWRMGFSLVNSPECIRPEPVDASTEDVNWASGTTYDIYEE